MGKYNITAGMKIKLLGDSITHGVGGHGFCQNGEHIVAEFSRNPDGYCWAKLFASHLKEKLECEVVNNACTGTKIEFVINNFDTLVSSDDDLVICTIGTNNRHQYKNTGEKRERDEMLEEFYENVLKLNSLFVNNGIRVIFVANIPASDSNELDGDDYWRILHMNDINDTYKRARDEAGFEFISMYDLFTSYVKESGTLTDDFLCDGLHPNDNGHRVIFELLTKELGVN